MDHRDLWAGAPVAQRPSRATCSFHTPVDTNGATESIGQSSWLSAARCVTTSIRSSSATPDRGMVVDVAVGKAIRGVGVDIKQIGGVAGVGQSVEIDHQARIPALKSLPAWLPVKPHSCYECWRPSRRSL